MCHHTATTKTCKVTVAYKPLVPPCCKRSRLKTRRAVASPADVWAWAEAPRRARHAELCPSTWLPCAPHDSGVCNNQAVVGTKKKQSFNFTVAATSRGRVVLVVCVVIYTQTGCCMHAAPLTCTSRSRLSHSCQDACAGDEWGALAATRR